MKLRLSIFTLILFLTGCYSTVTIPVFAGTTGKIIGQVIESATGEPLPGVNIIIDGTTLGAATDMDGSYFILNVPAGVYTLSVSFVGYRNITLENVQVVADFSTTQNFTLEAAPLGGEEIVITAERPLVQKDHTSTVKVMSSDEIQHLPTRGYQAVVALQPGVAEFGGGFSIRGGRLGETGYYVDGFSQTDPLTGMSTTVINNNAIDQISLITGGFNAEYGRIMSGVVNVITKGGTRHYRGNIEVVSDVISGDWLATPKYGYDIYNAAFSGPLIPRSERVLFFVSGERRLLGDRYPRAGAGAALPHNSTNGWNWQVKVNAELTTALKMELGSLGSTQMSDRYVHSYKNNLEHAPQQEDINNSAYLRFTHTLNPRAFYKLSVNYFYTERYLGDGLHFKNLEEYGREIPQNRTDDEFLFYAEDNLFNRIEHRESSYYGMKGNVVWQYNSNHELKTGFDLERHTLRLYQHLSPRDVYPDSPNPFLDLNVYGYDTSGKMHVNSGLNGSKNPVTVAFYLQDKIEYEGLVVNAGLRYDYISPRTDAFVRENNPLGDDNTLNPDRDLTESDVVSKVSPRIGIGFPISDRTVFFLNYGKFYQQPELRNLYVNYDFLQYIVSRTPYFFPFGNPNLRHEETTAYEMGVNMLLKENLRFSVATYYKTTKNLTQVTRIAGDQYFVNSFKNLDFGTVRGIDFELKLRKTERISAFLSYSLAFAKGTGSDPTTQRNIVFTDSEPPKLLAPLDFDQRHKLSMNMDYRIEKGGGPVLFGKRLFSESGINVLMSVRSGYPYTPTEVYNEITLGTVTSKPRGSVNSHYAPWVYQLDLKMNKVMRFWKFDYNFYVWIVNVLDRKNPLRVYTSTGLPNTTAWLATVNGQTYLEKFGEAGRQKYLDKENNPMNYDVPRLIRIGLQVRL